MSIKSRYAFLVLPLVVLACSEEIATPEGSTPFPTTLPDRAETTESNLKPAPVLDALRDAGKDAREPAKKGDAAALALPLGCTTFGEVEPNDQDNPQELGKGLCGTLIAADVDAFSGKSGGTPKTLRFTATGDAELVIRSLGAEKRIESNGSIEIPSFGPSLPFTISVTSPTDEPQAYRVVVED